MSGCEYGVRLEARDQTVIDYPGQVLQGFPDDYMLQLVQTTEIETVYKACAKPENHRIVVTLVPRGPQNKRKPGFDRGFLCQEREKWDDAFLRWFYYQQTEKGWPCA